MILRLSNCILLNIALNACFCTGQREHYLNVISFDRNISDYSSQIMKFRCCIECASIQLLKVKLDMTDLTAWKAIT